MDRTEVSSDQHLSVTVGDLYCKDPIRDSTYPNILVLKKEIKTFHYEMMIKLGSVLKGNQLTLTVAKRDNRQSQGSYM